MRKQYAHHWMIPGFLRLLKPSNQSIFPISIWPERPSSEISNFLEIHSKYIVVVYRSPPLVSTFYVYLTIITRCVPGESNIQNCIFDQYLPELTAHLIPVIRYPIQVIFGASGAFCALAHQRIFPCSFPLPEGRTCVTWKFNRGRQRITSHGITQSNLVSLHELHTKYYICGHSALVGNLHQRNECRMNNNKLKNINWQWFPRLGMFFLMWHSFSGPNRARQIRL